MADTPKPGVRTSEFWITVVATAGLLLVATGVWTPSESTAVQEAVQTVATVTAGVLPALYGVSRAVVKAFSR